MRRIEDAELRREVRSDELSGEERIGVAIVVDGEGDNEWTTDPGESVSHSGWTGEEGFDKARLTCEGVDLAVRVSEGVIYIHAGQCR